VENLLIIIPTKRKPPVKTLETYQPVKYPIVILADPSVYEEHQEYYRFSLAKVIPGAVGMGAQSHLCYVTAHELGFDKFFRMDDDHVPGMFRACDLMTDAIYEPSLDIIIHCANFCLKTLPVTLVGFQNKIGAAALSSGSGKCRETFTHISGGANLAVVIPGMLDDKVLKTLQRNEDSYRTCFHRKRALNQKNGRVTHIGVSWSKCYGKNTSILCSQEELTASEDTVSRCFPDMLTYGPETLLDERGLTIRKRRYLP
jgi:hypothetical protein